MFQDFWMISFDPRIAVKVFVFLAKCRALVGKEKFGTMF
jgi:hypothetical protein